MQERYIELVQRKPEQAERAIFEFCRAGKQILLEHRQSRSIVTSLAMSIFFLFLLKYSKRTFAFTTNDELKFKQPFAL